MNEFQLQLSMLSADTTYILPKKAYGLLKEKLLLLTKLLPNKNLYVLRGQPEGCHSRFLLCR